MKKLHPDLLKDVSMTVTTYERTVVICALATSLKDTIMKTMFGEDVLETLIKKIKEN